MPSLPKYAIIMKIGPFCGFFLEEIVAIKQKEERAIGRFFLGYSGVFCHPKRVKEFIALAKSEGEKIHVLFITTPSNFSSPIERLTEYSEDMLDWKKLGDDVLLVGSKFSIIGKGLKKANVDLDISQYRSMLGQTPGKRLHDYLKYRCDKSCAVHDPDQTAGAKQVTISYTCELTDEGCVYVK